MKTLLLSAGLLALVQSGGSPVLTPTEFTDQNLARASCVPTEPMPVARLDSTEVARYRMPVIKPDTARLIRMLFAPLVPCYQLEARATTLPQIVP
jgi:hypothetical protein